MADLSALLEKEASTEIETILSEARARASEMLASARAEADSIEAARARAVKAQGEAMLVRAKSAAQLEASSLRLSAQHEGVQGVFEAVRGKLEALASDSAAYAPLFGKLLSEALGGTAGQVVEAVVVSPKDRDLAVQAVAAAGVNAAVETAEDISAGVRLRTANRSVIENTLLGRLDALRGELASEVSTALFGAKAG